MACPFTSAATPAGAACLQDNCASGGHRTARKTQNNASWENLHCNRTVRTAGWLLRGRIDGAMRVGMIGTRRDLAQARAGLQEYRLRTDRLHGYSARTPDADSPSSTARNSCPPTRTFAATREVDYVDVCTFPDFRLEPHRNLRRRPASTCRCRSPSPPIWKPRGRMMETARRAASCWGW